MVTKNVNRKSLLENELNRIINILIKEYLPLKVILFGSLSSGAVSENSDIDLLIVKETSKRYLARVDEVLHLLHPKAGMDLFVLTPEEVQQGLDDNNPYLEEILTKGTVLYAKAG